jgi:hypothetical protein
MKERNVKRPRLKTGDCVKKILEVVLLQGLWEYGLGGDLKYFAGLREQPGLDLLDSLIQPRRGDDR